MPLSPISSANGSERAALRLCIAGGALLALAFDVIAQTPVMRTVDTELQRKESLVGMRALTIPELVFSSSATRSASIVAAPDGSLPAVDFQIATSGGAGPIRFTIAGPGAPWFQIVTPDPTFGIAPSPAQVAAQEMEARVNPKPAGVQTRTVRFLGRAGSGEIPTSFTAQIVATDARGRSASIDVTAFPFAPRIAPIEFGRSAHQTSQVLATVQGLGAATEVRLDGIGGACGYSQNPNISYGNAVQAALNGSASFARTASFRTASEACSSLRVTIAARFPGAANFSAPVVLTVPTFSFVPRQRYVFEDTWSLRNLLKFAVRKSHTGICSGESVGFNGTHAVGVVQTSNDIAMKIRSGPLGTECDFTSVSARLPDGFMLTELDFAHSEGPNDSPTNVTMGEPRRYCSIGGTGGTVGLPASFNFSRGTEVIRTSDLTGATASNFVLEGWGRPLVTTDQVSFDIGSDTEYAVMLLPWYLKLRCVTTPSNSEFITVRLNRVVFTGPPGATFP